ncbi:MAG: nuclear transport factor 2 family protein [Luteolibacter sp.]
MNTVTALPDTTGPAATVRQFIEGFNNGDTKVMAAMCAVPMSILDGMAPHVWHGPTAAEDWYRDAMIEGEHLGVSGYLVTLGEAIHDNITGDSAYCCFPATMTFNLRGSQVTQRDAFFTVALRKLSDGWRIASWAWTKGATKQHVS